MPRASAKSALMLEYPQVKSEENSSTRSFDALENVGITSADKEKFSSTVFRTQSNETSVENLSPQRCPSITPTDTASLSGNLEHLKVTEEPEAQTLKYDLEIPPQAKILSVPLSFFPTKMQQLISTRTKDVSEVREATETPTVIYICPVLKTEEACKHFRDIIPNSLIPTSPNLARHCSSFDAVAEDVKCSQITPMKQLAEEELDSKKTESYSLTVKSSNSVVSRILKSLTSIKNKDYNNILPLPSIGPIGEKMKIPVCNENAMMIHNGQVYFVCVKRHEVLSPAMNIHNRDMLLRNITICFITCRTICDITTRDSHPLLSSQCVVKQNIKPLTNGATHQGEASNATHFSSHRMTTTPQPKQHSLLTGKGQQAFPRKAAFQSKKELQKRNKREVQQKEDYELRKKFGILKDIRIHLKRINSSELTVDSGKTPTLKLKFPRKAAFPSKGKLQKRNEREAQQKEDNERRNKFGIVKDIRIHLKRTTF